MSKFGYVSSDSTLEERNSSDKEDTFIMDWINFFFSIFKVIYFKLSSLTLNNFSIFIYIIFLIHFFFNLYINIVKI